MLEVVRWGAAVIPFQWIAGLAVDVLFGHKGCQGQGKYLASLVPVLIAKGQAQDKPTRAGNECFVLPWMGREQDETVLQECCDVCRIHSLVSAARSAHPLIASGLCSRLWWLRHPLCL